MEKGFAKKREKYLISREFCSQNPELRIPQKLKKKIFI